MFYLSKERKEQHILKIEISLEIFFRLNPELDLKSKVFSNGNSSNFLKFGEGFIFMGKAMDCTG